MSLVFGANTTDRVEVTTTVALPATGTLAQALYVTSDSTRQRWCNFTGADGEFAEFRGDIALDPIRNFISRNGGANYWRKEANAGNFASWGINKWIFYFVIWDHTTGTNGTQKLLMGDLTTPPTEASAYVTEDVGSGTIDAVTNLVLCNNAGFGIPLIGRHDGFILYPFAATIAQCETIWRQWNGHPIATPQLNFKFGRGAVNCVDWSSALSVTSITGATLGESMPRPISITPMAHKTVAVGRVTKNTRAFPLGMDVGMNWQASI